MHITKEDTGALTASIKMQITSEDYEEKVTKTLKDYQRKATIPGFRPGKVPSGMIAKMYRKGVLLDEINHLISENLQNYIEENQIKLLGNPVPDKEKSSSVDLDNQTEFEFYFDIGLSPEFELDLSGKFSVDYLAIKATEKMIDQNIEELRHRSKNHDLDHEPEAHEHNEEELPELNEEFFNRVFPGQEIKDITIFRGKIKEMIEQSLVQESERYFLNTAIEKLVHETRLELPDDFLRKMLRENEEHKLNDEEIEKQYVNFSNSIKWQLIESKIVKDYNLQVNPDEIRNVIKSYFTGHMTNEEENPEQDERLNKIVDSVLSNKEETNRLHDQLFDKKLLNFFKENIKLEPKEVDYDEFIKLVTQKKA
jgi:FKBP-type peptidyl-prolyl cis-trans isomerase (trigger factor)